MARYSIFALAIVYYIGLFALPTSALAAAEPASSLAVVKWFEELFQTIVSGLESFLFYPIFGFPALVLWLMLGGIYFTIITKAVSIRLFPHAFKVVTDKYARPGDPGEISHFQAMATSVSGTVGLGNIAGVSVAVAVGGPGAVIWMVVAGIFAMATKFSEATLGHKFRVIEKDGMVRAGAFLYLREGLNHLGKERLGTVLSFVFAIFCLGGAFGAGNMFQSNQTVAILTDTFEPLSDAGWIIALLLAVTVGGVLIGGITRIASVTEKMVPAMAMIYILACVTVLVANSDVLGEAISLMFSQALTGSAATGGALGAIITGFQRSAFSNEGGTGSASIVHPAARNPEPVRAGCTAILGTFVDTMIICTLTGLVITVTGVYEASDKTGIELASASFQTVVDWFPTVLSVCVFFFAFSTMITWSYYGEQAWLFLFKGKCLRFYQVLFSALVFFGGATQKTELVLDFSDLLFFSMAIPNLIGLYFMSGILRAEVRSYVQRLKNGDFLTTAQRALQQTGDDAELQPEMSKKS